jgi:hypothetical protein
MLKLVSLWVTEFVIISLKNRLNNKYTQGEKHCLLALGDIIQLTKLTSGSRDLPGSLLGSQAIPAFCETRRRSLLWSREPGVGLCHEPDESSPQPRTDSF